MSRDCLAADERTANALERIADAMEDRAGAEDRIVRALSLIDTWLHDVSDDDDGMRRMMWDHVREVRSALAGGTP